MNKTNYLKAFFNFFKSIKVELMDVTTIDGKLMIIREDGFVEDETGNIVMDGIYELKNGTSIEIKDGKVLTQASEEDVKSEYEEPSGDTIESLKEKIKNLMDKVAEMEVEMKKKDEKMSEVELSKVEISKKLNEKEEDIKKLLKTKSDKMELESHSKSTTGNEVSDRILDRFKKKINKK